jgi:hypothetical protein
VDPLVWLGNDDRRLDLIGKCPAAGQSTVTSLHTWEVVDLRRFVGATFLDVWLHGAGSGGGGGFIKLTGAAGCGGGGGGGSNKLFARFLLEHLPDILYFFVPTGGVGGIAGGSGGVGLAAVMSTKPSVSSSDWIMQSGTNINGGNGGSASVGGAAGPAGSNGFAALLGLAMSSTTLPGSAGAVGGGPVANGIPSNYNNGVSGGGSGAGSTSADLTGGGVNFSGPWIGTLTAGPAGNGLPGFSSLGVPGMPLHFGGGSGAGSGNTVPGGRGGDGAIGAGGGGGGAGLVGGSLGGNGGPAMAQLRFT